MRSGMGDSMNFAFAIFKYFPFGGLQRDMLRMAECAAGRGHRVTVFTASWKGEEPPDGIQVRILKVRGWSNHGRARSFERLFRMESAPFDARLLFNRMGGGDFYFAADNCLAVEYPRKHSALMLRLNPRYRTFLEQERTVFEPAAKTRIFYIAPRQKRDFMKVYHTPESRFFYLPPGMNEKCRRPADADRIRRGMRKKLGLTDEQRMLVLIGSNYRLKGAFRAIEALGALPEPERNRCVLYLIGESADGGCSAHAEKCGVAGQVVLAGPRTDVPELLLAADLMIHPSRNEATGTVLVEGIAAGLPVLCTEECGFSNFVQEASGLVVPEGAEQSVINAMTADALSRLPELRERTIRYALGADFYRRAEVAVDALEAFVREKR